MSRYFGFFWWFYGYFASGKRSLLWRGLTTET